LRAPGSASPGTTGGQPSIDAPVGLFCGTGTLYNRDGREYLVKGFTVRVRDDGKRGHLARALEWQNS